VSATGPVQSAELTGQLAGRAPGAHGSVTQGVAPDWPRRRAPEKTPASHSRGGSSPELAGIPLWCPIPRDLTRVRMLVTSRVEQSQRSGSEVAGTSPGTSRGGDGVRPPTDLRLRSSSRAADECYGFGRGYGARRWARVRLAATRATPASSTAVAEARARRGRTTAYREGWRGEGRTECSPREHTRARRGV
jgi:hypothetical protein